MLIFRSFAIYLGVYDHIESSVHVCPNCFPIVSGPGVLNVHPISLTALLVLPIVV